VHQAYSAKRSDCVYITSTRHPLGTELFARFEEEHSHASAHLIHLPTDPETRQLMLQARSLILVDDEASTGKTFINLYQALLDAGLHQLERVVTCVLTDWSAGAVGRAIGSRASSVSLLEGSYAFHEDPTAPLPDMPDRRRFHRCVAAVAQGDWGRLGVRHVGYLGSRVAGSSWRESHRDRHQRVRLAAVSSGRAPGACAGVNVHFSSTSRSPIALGHAIGHALSFSDNYGLGIPNFLYNVRGQFDRVLICSDTGPGGLRATDRGAGRGGHRR
jgi:hypothetical protein